MHVSLTRIQRLSIATVLALLLASCCWHSELTKSLPSQQQVGAVHVAPLSIALWSDYVATLQPQFNITPDSAYQLALPSTSSSQSNVFSGFLAGAQIGLPQTTKISSDSSTVVNGTSTVSQSQQSQSSAGVAPANNTTALTAPDVTKFVSPVGTFQSDPILHYTAASAIYEEVQLLNRYLQDAALRHGYTAYIARMQVSVEPYAHLQPYDVYVDISFNDKNINASNSPDSKPIYVLPLLVTDDLETGQAANAADIARQLALSLGGVIHNVGLQSQFESLESKYRALLGTDLNSLFMVSRVADTVLHARVGAARNPDSNFEMIAQTHNITFVMLVPKPIQNNYFSASCNSNKLQYAISSSNTPGDEKKNANPPQVWAVALSQFRNAESGKTISTDPDIIDARLDKVFVRFAHPGTEEGDLALARLRAQKQALKYYIGTSQAASFSKCLGQIEADTIPSGKRCGTKELDDSNKSNTNPPPDACAAAIDTDSNQSGCVAQNGKKTLTEGSLTGVWESIWTGVASATQMSEYSNLEFELPTRRMQPIDLYSVCSEPGPSNSPNQLVDQAILLREDGKGSMNTQIPGLGTLAPSLFAARLTIQDGATITATAITQTAPGAPFTVQFPSLSFFMRALPGGLAVSDGKSTKASSAMSLELTPVQDARWGDVTDLPTYHFNNVYYLSEPVEVPSDFTLVTATDSLIAGAPAVNAGQARLLLGVRAGVGPTNFDTILIKVFGGVLPDKTIINAVNGTTMSAADNSIQVPVAAFTPSTPEIALDIPVQSALAGRVMTFIATEMKGGKPIGSSQQVSIPVVAGATASKPAS